jgi:membrane-associated phospholipid phosphatase
MHGRRKALGALAVAALTAGLAAPAFGTSAAAADRGSSAVAFAPGSGRLVVDWNRLLIKSIGTSGAQPATVHPTRSFAILQAAEYDAVVSTTHADQPYLFEVAAPRDARPDAAADQAAHDVLAALYPSLASGPDQLLTSELAAIPDGPAKQDGINVGSAVANHLLAARSSDGSAVTPPPFVPGSQPGDYRPTPPNFPAPVFTNWGTVTPFVLARGSQFRPSPPPAITSRAYATALNEVKSLGQDSSTTRTADQTVLAKFWGAAPIWNVWNQIAQSTTLAHQANLEKTTLLFSKLDLAIADTTIGLYEAKYHYQVWRPVTAIRLGDTANNPRITGDPNWTPLAVTAPDPSYPGAHSAISQTAASVLSAVYRGHQQLVVTSDGMPGVTRNFSSFQAAATEAGLSRIFAGQHTRLDHKAGQNLGENVAGFVLQHRTSATVIPLP